MAEEKGKRRAIAAALAWTKGTSIEAGAYEEWLLEEYASGRLSIEGVITVLEEVARARLDEESRNWSR